MEYFLYSLGFVFFEIALSHQKLLRQKEQKLFKKEKANLELQIENQKLENRRIEADYNYLRTQINPHFLYNTLNYFYGKVAPVDEEAGRGVLLLTKIMQYSLHKGDEQGKVPLALEINSIYLFYF